MGSDEPDGRQGNFYYLEDLLLVDDTACVATV
jgi:hypothetical protein